MCKMHGMDGALANVLDAASSMPGTDAKHVNAADSFISYDVS
jgi:hypothetical protein